MKEIKKAALACVAAAACLLAAGSAPAEPIASGETKIGTLMSPDFVQSWTFEGTAGQRVVVTATNITGNLQNVQPEIWLYPPAGGDPEAWSLGSFPWHRLDHQLAAGGTYTLTIRESGANASGYYGLSLAVIGGALSSPGDPDGGALAPGSTATGLLSPAGDMDAFTIEGQAGERVILTVARQGTNAVQPSIYLYPPGGGACEAYYSGTLDRSRLEWVLQADGPYTLLVSDYQLQDVGYYAVSLVRIPGPATSEGDDDGGEILPAETRAGVLSQEADTDVFTFSAEAGDRVVITAAALAGTVQPALYLYPPGSGPRAAADEAYLAEKWLEQVIDVSGTWTLVIGEAGFNGTGAYALALLKMPGTLSSAADPDGGILVSGGTATGTLAGEADTDAWSFRGRQGDRVVITAALLSGGTQPAIRLYAPGGGAVEASDTVGMLTERRLDHALASSGVYTVVVSDSGLNGEGYYALALAAMPGTSSSPSDTDGGLIASGETMTGAIAYQADTDVYRFYGRAGDLVTVVAARYPGAPGAGVDPCIHLYPPGGGEAEAVKAELASSNRLDHTLALTGLYTIVVSDYQMDEDGYYTLSLSRQPSDPAGFGRFFPPDGCTVTGAEGNFRWDPVEGATGYDLYYKRDPLAEPEDLSGTIAETSFPWPAFAAGDRIHWQVVAHTPVGDLPGPWLWLEAGDAPRTMTDDFSDGGRNGDPEWVDLLYPDTWTVNRKKRYVSAYNYDNKTVWGDPDQFVTGVMESRLCLTTTFVRFPHGELVFGVQYDQGRGELNYRYVRLKQGRIIIGQAGDYEGEAAGVKASRRRRITTGVWYKVRVEILPDGWVRVYLNDGANAAVAAQFARPAPGWWGYSVTGAKTVFDDFSASVGAWQPRD